MARLLFWELPLKFDFCLLNNRLLSMQMLDVKELKGRPIMFIMRPTASLTYCYAINLSREKMIRLRKFEHFARKGKTDETIEFINHVRSNYPFSRKTYTESDTANVYLIVWQRQIAGFCEVEIQNTCLEVPQKTQLYLHELHVVEKAQRKGIGRDTIYHLLELGLPIELVVANDNSQMVSLIKKFGAEILYEPKNVKTYIIKSVRGRKGDNHA